MAAWHHRKVELKGTVPIMPRRKQMSVQQPVPQPVVLDPLLTVAEVQQIFRLSKPKIYELMAHGLPSLKIDGARRFEPAAVQAWIALQREQHVS